MNLQLIKIKRQNAFDYNLLSEFMTKKNGKFIFKRGFGNTGGRGRGDNSKKGNLNLMEKFERKFQMQSILKSYNETFHKHHKSLVNNLTGNNNETCNFVRKFPYINNGRKTANLKLIHYPNRHKRNIKTSNIAFKINKPFVGRSAKIPLTSNNNQESIDKKDDNTIDYNNYFYHTVDNFPQGMISENYDKELNTNVINNSTSYNNMFTESRNKKLLKNNSQDCIYLFGQNKIVLRNKKDKNKYPKSITQNYDKIKPPFIDYEKDTNPYKIRIRLKKNFEFFKADFEDFSEIKREYILKTRKLFDIKHNIKYKFGYLPSHDYVRTIIRKRNKSSL